MNYTVFSALTALYSINKGINLIKALGPLKDFKS